MGHRLEFPKYTVFLSLKIDFVLENSADPMQCHLVRHFILVFTVFQSISFRVSGLQEKQKKFSLRL